MYIVCLWLLSLTMYGQDSARLAVKPMAVQPVEKMRLQPAPRLQRVPEREEPAAPKPKKRPAKKPQKPKVERDTVRSEGKDSVKISMVYLEHSETLSFDEERLPDAQILKGNVCFRHDSALMYCDSAYFFNEENSLHAFGHVHLLQGDSIEGWGDVLYYNGNTKMARFRRHVRLTHQGTEITTDSMNYDRLRDIAYYFSGGTIRDSLNTLTSRRGQYLPNEHQALFRDDVHLVNPNFTLTADSLGYNTESYQADLVAPTTILYEEETTILTSEGWYNTETEQSMLLARSRIIHEDGMTLTGDTIYYDKRIGHGRVMGNMQSVDSTNQMTLYGDRGEMWDENDRGYVTDSALLVEWSDSTCYTYIHADTLFTEQVPYRTFRLTARDSILVDSVMTAQAPDTVWVDTNYLQLRAYYGVRIYREDMQAVCDSIHYQGRDSIATMLGSPVCWNEQNQVSADSIKIYIKDGAVDYLHGNGNAIAIKQETAEAFNQLAGKEMYAYVEDNDVHLVEVLGNAETVFYPRENDGSFMGVNKTQSSHVKLYLEDRQVHHIVFTTATTGVMIPLREAQESERKLGSFFWAAQERPLQPGDVFLSPERTERPSAVAVSAVSTEEDEEEEEENSRRRTRDNDYNNDRRQDDVYLPANTGMGTMPMGGMRIGTKR